MAEAPRASTILGRVAAARPAGLRPCITALFALFFPLLLSLLMFRHAVLAAGPPPQPNAAQIALGLRKLGVAGSVLYVAAHPDDENTALLAYLANGALLRTAYLSLTRGDGGQNLIGSEQGPALGLIRTQELLAARRIDGAEQFFTRARDFGFSKSPDETLRIWGKDAVLADVVAVIRTVPSRRHRHPLFARAGGDPRAPHRLGDPGAGGVSRRRRSQVSPRAAGGWRRRLAGAADLLEPIVLLHQADRRRERRRQAGRRRLQPAARRVVRRDGGRQPQHAQEPGVRRGADARRRSSSTSSCWRSADPKEAAAGKPLGGILDGIDVTLEALRRGDAAAWPGRQGDREGRSRGALR